MPTTLPLLHFNDVYRVLQTSKTGTISADQFAAKIARIRVDKWKEQSRALEFLDQEDEKKSTHTLHGLTLFSGDVFNPSIESSVTRGEHMVEVMNAMSIDLSLVGNHDLDFGFPHLQKLMQQTNFPWTFTNIVDVKHTDLQRDNGEQLQPLSDSQVSGTLRFKVFEVDVANESERLRVCCIGLVERDWIATVPAFPPNFRYRSMVEMAKTLSKELRDPSGEHRCDLIIAITHCRLPNDIDLANSLGAIKNAPENEHGVDLILGGHDHTYYIGNGIDGYEGAKWKTSMPGTEKDKSCMVIKSGTDFHDLSEIELSLSAPNESAIRRRIITGSKVRRHQTMPSDETLPELKAHIDELMKRVDQATGEPVAFSLTPLDCSMDVVRTREAAVGSFVADILLHSYDAALRDRDDRGELSESRHADQREIDMALICGGSLRGDSSFGPGLIALRDILTIMPFEDAVIVRQLKGKDIIEALENGFAAYPSQEGRFPQLAGVSVEWDSSKPSGSRIVEVRLLEDVHMFHNDGSRRHEMPSEADGGQDNAKVRVESGEAAETFAFERSEEGGYSIEVTKPRIRKGELLKPDQVYRVVTREYMADGHDGYEALTRACGEDLIDHENGSLMSTQVRKFLLGASLIWRLKALRDSSDEKGTGMVGHETTLSSKTRKAIERAKALSGHDDDIKRTRGNDQDVVSANGLTVAVNDGVMRAGRPSPLQFTSAGAEVNSIMNTPPRPKAGSAVHTGRRVVIDSSPGSFRDAIHVGSSEHHSSFDAASRSFRSSRGRKNVNGLPRSAGGAQSAGFASLSLSHPNNLAEEPVSAPARTTGLPDEPSGTDNSLSEDDISPEVSFAHPMTASTITGENEESTSMTGSSYFTSRAVRKHVEVNAEDGEWLRSAEESLAIIAPMCDGRIVDRARARK